MRRSLVLLVALVAALLLLSTCFVFVDQTEYAYITRFGRLIDDRPITEPGLQMKLPWPIDSVRRFDRRLQIFEPPALERITRDKKSLTIGSYVCWKIADAHRFFLSVGTIPDAQRRLEEQISAQISAAIGKRDLSQLVSVEPGKSEIEPMMSQLTEQLKQSAGPEFGIDIVDVRLKRFNHPSEVRPAIYDRIRSERNRDAVRYRSEGESEAQKIRSRADLERDKILARAEAEATELRGKAEAEKTRILNDAHSKDPAFYSLLRTLEAYRKILDDKTTLVLSTDNAIFQLLTDKSSPLMPNATPAVSPSPMTKSPSPSPPTAPSVPTTPSAKTSSSNTNSKANDAAATTGGR